MNILNISISQLPNFAIQYSQKFLNCCQQCLCVCVWRLRVRVRVWYAATIQDDLQKWYTFVSC